MARAAGSTNDLASPSACAPLPTGSDCVLVQTDAAAIVASSVYVATVANRCKRLFGRHSYVVFFRAVNGCGETLDPRPDTDEDIVAMARAIARMTRLRNLELKEFITSYIDCTLGSHILVCD